MSASLFRSLNIKLYSFAFLEDFVLIYPFYTLFFSDNGMSAGQIATLLIVWSATAFFLEVPSGAIADTFSRKQVLIVAQAFRALGFTIWLLFPSFWGFLVGFILWGIDSALTSGTKEALVYDELTRLERSSQYAKIIGRMEAWGLAGIILAGFVASALSGLGYGFILGCSIAAGVGTILVLCTLPKAASVESTEETGYFSHLKEGVRETYSKKVVLIAVIFLSLTAGFQSIDEFFNLLFREKGFDNSMVALWFGIISIFGMIGSLVAHHFERRALRLELLLIGWGLSLLAAALLGGAAVPLSIGVFTMFFYVLKVLFTANLQHALSDTARATATSVSGFLSELGAILINITMGGLAGMQSYQFGFMVVAIVIIALSALLWLFARSTIQPTSIKQLGL